MDATFNPGGGMNPEDLSCQVRGIWYQRRNN